MTETTRHGRSVEAAPRAEQVDLLDVLVVDDSEDLRALVGVVLGMEPGWRVRGEAADGMQAIQQAQAVRPDLVLLDAAMPVMDGFEALPHLRAVVPDAVIVLFTAFPRATVVDDALRLGADECLEKSDLVASLCPRLRVVLERAQRLPGQRSPS